MISKCEVMYRIISMRIETDRNCVQWGADPHRGSSKYSPWCEPGGGKEGSTRSAGLSSIAPSSAGGRDASPKNVINQFFRYFPRRRRSRRQRRFGVHFNAANDDDSVRQFILVKSAKLCALHFVFFATCRVANWSKKIGD